MTTTFFSQCEILGELWMDYREDEEFQEFIEHNDLGLPLGYLFASGIVTVATDKAVKLVRETFDLFLGSMNIEDTGFETLADVFDGEGDQEETLTSRETPMEKIEYKYVSLTWKEFEEQFKPIKNHFSKNPDEIKFETDGEEHEFVLSKQYENKIWTYTHGDHRSFVANRYHYVNRIAYYITEVPYDDTTLYQIVVSTEEKCECYDEDREDNDGEFGAKDCARCGGYGLVTKYKK